MTTVEDVKELIRESIRQEHTEPADLAYFDQSVAALRDKMKRMGVPITDDVVSGMVFMADIAIQTALIAVDRASFYEVLRIIIQAATSIDPKLSVEAQPE